MALKLLFALFYLNFGMMVFRPRYDELDELHDPPDAAEADDHDNFSDYEEQFTKSKKKKKVRPFSISMLGTRLLRSNHIVFWSFSL